MARVWLLTRAGPYHSYQRVDVAGCRAEWAAPREAGRQLGRVDAFCAFAGGALLTSGAALWLVPGDGRVRMIARLPGIGTTLAQRGERAYIGTEQGGLGGTPAAK